MAIKLIVFDIGGVLSHYADPEPHYRWESRLGLTNGELGKLVFTVGDEAGAMIGRTSERDLFMQIGVRFGLDAAATQTLMREFWDCWQMDMAFLEYFKSLQTRYRTAILSNAWSEARPALEERYNINSAAHILIFSAEVGMEKPDPRIYQLLLDQVDVASHETIFVDDNLENIVAAQKLGIHGIQFESAVQVKAALDKLLKR